MDGGSYHEDGGCEGYDPYHVRETVREESRNRRTSRRENLMFSKKFSSHIRLSSTGSSRTVFELTLRLLDVADG